MAVQLPAFAQDLAYPFWVLRKQMASIATAGVVNPSTDFVVSPSSGLQVQITSGAAFVAQTVNIEGSSAYNGVYWVLNDATANPYNTVTAPVANPRIDQIILRIYDAIEQGLGGASKAQLEWLGGTESASASLSTMGPGKSNPGAAPLPANSLLLDYVLQPVGASSISASNIVPAVSGSVSLTGGPVGQISHHAGSSDVAGADGVVRWMICDGRAISRTTYLALFDLVGTTYGAGDGSTTFNIPDLRGRVAIGADPSGVHLPTNHPALGASGGEEQHTLTTPEIPSHTHNAGTGNFMVTGGASLVEGAGFGFTQTTSTASTGGGGAHNNLQPYLAVNHVIKVL
jgi:microcystin-dependent protein